MGQLREFGFNERTLCDTLGVATPDRVYSFSRGLQASFPGVDFGLHLHDSCGRALACVMAGLQAGITRYDTAVGGLGGCPCGSASGETDQKWKQPHAGVHSGMWLKK